MIKQPTIPAHKNLPELTAKSIFLGILLAILLGSANAYLSLKVGMTISASIPAAIISMGVLRFFKHSNILENNIVQTAASAGEALTAGIAFTVPALLVTGSWDTFNYWQTVLIALLGGWLGVFFTIPIRQVLLHKEELPFPEGTAIGKVLTANIDGGATLKPLIYGSAAGGLISLCQTGLRVLTDTIEKWVYVGHTVVGFGAGFSPALIAAGYIVGAEVVVSEFLGVLVGWVIAVPLLTLKYHYPATDALDLAHTVWSAHSRYIGIGIMIVGGLWTMLTLIKPMIDGIKASLRVVEHGDEQTSNLRTERDMPFKLSVFSIILLTIPITALLYHNVPDQGLSLAHHILITAGLSLSVLLVSFLAASVCAYFAGLVGSSTSPVSGINLIVLMIMAVVVSVLFTWCGHEDTANKAGRITLAILATSILAVIGSLGNDNIQDLKAGQIVGATPWKQQFMLLVGVTSAAFVIPFVLNLLYHAYGIGGSFPHPGMERTQMLSAPQANLIASVTRGIIEHHMQWGLIFIGAVTAISMLIIDKFLRHRGLRIHILAVGLGAYLPFSASMPLFFGGLIAYFVKRRLKRIKRQEYFDKDQARSSQQTGLLLCCGLVAGSALMGVILAIPFVIAGSSNALNIAPRWFTPLAYVATIIVTIGLVRWIYRVAVGPQGLKKKII